MTGRKTKTAVIFILCAAICLISSFAALFFYNDTNALAVFSSDSSNTISVNVSVVDLENFEKVPFAVLMLSEKRIKVNCNENGKTTFTLKTDTISDKQRMYGFIETDILVYADGYPPHAFLNCCIYQHEKEMTLYLQKSENAVVSSVFPKKEDVIKMLDKNRP